MAGGAQTATATDGGAWAVTGTANALAVATAALFTNSSSFPAPSTFENIAGPPLTAQDLHWTALGDSWASGVTYKHDPSLDWTAPRDEKCRRILDAYAVQLYNDTTWSGARRQIFTFPACSGSRYADIQGQTNFMGDKPEFATLTIGGNDANFFPVVRDCIYQYDTFHSYGGEYPAPGDCADSIAQAQTFISSGQLATDVQSKAIQVVYDAGVNNFPGFKVFLTGYAHFFNVDDDATDCNDQSFGPGLHRPKLTMVLRKAINNLVEQINTAYSNVVASMNNPDIQFLDISPGFDGHRFCEPGQDNYDNENSNQEGETWIWNFHWFWPNGVDNGTAPADEIDPASSDFSRGEIARIFHPTRQGHGAIKEIVKIAVRKAYDVD